MKFLVLGGAGSMGRIVIKDLIEFSPSDAEIIVADRDLSAAQALVESIASPKLSARMANATDIEECAKLFKGVDVVVNCVQYRLNPQVMRAALKAKCHYVDLGGLFHVTLEQLKLHEEFKEKNLLAICGMGAAPGITNLLAAWGAEQCDEVTEIHTRVAGVDRTRYEPANTFSSSYSLETIMEEFSLKPAVFTQGAMKFVEPMTGDTPVLFPRPIGRVRPMYTIHSEVATLPESFKAKGVKEVSFKIAFNPDFLKGVKFLRDVGLASGDPIRVGEVLVKPIQVASRVVMARPQPKVVGSLKQYEVVRAIVKGKKGKKKITHILDCHTQGIRSWGLGTDVNTGCPPAIAALLIAKGEITARGALPPEKAITDLRRFFDELKKRKMLVKASTQKGWGLKT